MSIQAPKEFVVTVTETRTYRFKVWAESLLQARFEGKQCWANKSPLGINRNVLLEDQSEEIEVETI